MSLSTNTSYYPPSSGDECYAENEPPIAKRRCFGNLKKTDKEILDVSLRHLQPVIKAAVPLETKKQVIWNYKLQNVTILNSSRQESVTEILSDEVLFRDASYSEIEEISLNSDNLQQNTLQKLKHFPNLQILRIEGNNIADNVGLEHINCPNLEFLDTDVPDINFARIYQIFQQNATLTKFGAYCRAGSNVNNIDNLINAFPRITRVYIYAEHLLRTSYLNMLNDALTTLRDTHPNVKFEITSKTHLNR